ncbi:LysR family transcriptional regulator [Aliidongia dinghuensis]|uniref:LysR family transcriptional regulator n=1 Tax=Aliidongia dinghuensis TaxID=1867774 RepID=A0A8J2YXA9_9PROT|nr:LysR substrate-binding domain-containing protein [Aliidongia dinghuensis]GGF35530.1 LysR family transcriptional regulator [Aliidongia dinghuensis]
MNLRDLAYAVSLAADGHFRRAAERCNVSQPTLSAQIAKLEDELGVQLFERGPRGATPTLNGRALLHQAAVVLDAVERLKELARAAHDPLVGPFQLGVIPTVGPYLMPRLLPLLKANWPALKLHLREDRTDQLVERLRDGALDAAILSLPVEAEDLRMEPLYDERMLLALPTGHPLAANARVRHEALSTASVMLLEDGHCLRDQTMAFCRTSGLGAQSDVQAASLETLRQMVMAGIGLALVPALATEPPFGLGPMAVYRRFEDPEPRRTLVLTWRRSFPRGDALRGLAKALSDALATDASAY